MVSVLSIVVARRDGDAVGAHATRRQGRHQRTEGAQRTILHVLTRVAIAGPSKDGVIPRYELRHEVLRAASVRRPSVSGRGCHHGPNECQHRPRPSVAWRWVSGPGRFTSAMPKRRRKHRGPRTPRKGLDQARTKPWTISPAALGVLAVGWAICFMTLHGYRRPFGEEATIAWHVAMGHGFSSPVDVSPSAPPSAWSAPLYPLTIAAAYRLFGIASPASTTALMLLNAVFLGVIVVGTERLSKFLFGSPVPGLLGAALLAIHPLFLFYLADFWDGFMGLAMFVWLTTAAVRLGRVAESGGATSYAQACAFGAGMGLLALTNASYAVSYPVLLYQAFRQKLVVDRWRGATVAGITCLLVISPWTIRNYAAFGRLVPVRTGGAIQLWIGNAPVSDGWIDAGVPPVHPYVNAAEGKLLLTVGEPAYNDLAFNRFEKGLIANPLGYVASCLRRATYMIVGKPTAARYPVFVDWKWRGVFWGPILLNASVALLAVAGMAAARRFHYRQSGLPVLAASVALPFIATAVSNRYTLPLRWLLIVYAGFCGWVLFRLYRRSSGVPLKPHVNKSERVRAPEPATVPTQVGGEVDKNT